MVDIPDEDDDGSDEDDLQQMETTMDDVVEEKRGQLMRAGVLYDFNEVKDEPKANKVDKDIAVRLKIKSKLGALAKLNQSKPEVEDEEAGETDDELDEEHAVEI